MKRFPVLFGFLMKGTTGCPRDIPWDIIQPHEKQALINHSQRLNRLAARGGLDPSEIVAVLEDRRWRRMEMKEAVNRMKELLAGPTGRKKC